MPKGNKKVKRWRQFERLVALLESHLGSKGATIRSPDHIPDKITGQSREVDISVRYQLGSIPILVTIECRDRKSEEDTIWIEQLAKKREDIGASVTVAVSSTGFSQPALQKAKFHGIETRTLRNVSEDSIKAWANSMSIIAIKGTFGLGRLGIRYRSFEVDNSPQLDPAIKNEYSKGDVEYKFIRRNIDNQLRSIGDYLREHEQKL